MTGHFFRVTSETSGAVTIGRRAVSAFWGSFLVFVALSRPALGVIFGFSWLLVAVTHRRAVVRCEGRVALFRWGHLLNVPE